MVVVHVDGGNGRGLREPGESGRARAGLGRGSEPMLLLLLNPRTIELDLRAVSGDSVDHELVVASLAVDKFLFPELGGPDAQEGVGLGADVLVELTLDLIDAAEVLLLERRKLLRMACLELQLCQWRRPGLLWWSMHPRDGGRGAAAAN